MDNKKYIGISDDRLFHMHRVAEKCYILAKYKYSLSEKASRTMYFMGFVHDIGYRFTDDPTNHAETFADFLDDIISIDEVKLAILHHGNPEYIPQWTIYDRILNEADMTSSPDGYDVFYDDRLEDIKLRYGVGSKQYKDSVKIVEKLKN